MDSYALETDESEQSEVAPVPLTSDSASPDSSTAAQAFQNSNEIEKQALLPVNFVPSDPRKDGGVSEAPEWLRKRFGVAKIACMEFPSGLSIHNVVLQYCAHRAVDVDEPLPRQDAEDAAAPLEDNTSDTEDEIEEQVDEARHEYDSVIARRRRPRKKELELDEMPKSMKHERDLPGRLSTLTPHYGSDILLKRRKTVIRFRLGFGVAKVGVDGSEVYVWYRKIDKAVACAVPAVFKVCTAYAANAELVRKFAKNVLDWELARIKARERVRLGKYRFYSLVFDFKGRGCWAFLGNKKARRLDTVILPKGEMDAIVADMEEFLKKGTKAWFAEHGIPHRRSFLFYGPPGSGKTSTIRALAGKFKLSACFLNVSEKKFSDQSFVEAMVKLPDRAMLVLEDIDVLFNRDRQSQNQSTMTFSGLLNALDGLMTMDGILTIMTTNHIEKLDPALIRAGRVDRRFEFKAPVKEQIERMFQSFYPESTQSQQRDFGKRIMERRESDARLMSTLQEHFVFTRSKTAQESLEMVDEFFTSFYPDGANIGNAHLYQ